jgi:Tol biopolymer transport system component
MAFSRKYGEEGLYTINPDGTGMQSVLSTTGLIFGPRISPDRTLLAYTRSAGQPVSDIFVYDMTRGAERNITNSPASYFSVSWYPDGEWVLAKVELTSPDYYRIPVEGGEWQRVDLTVPDPRDPTYEPYPVDARVSNDGTRIVYGVVMDYHTRDLWIANGDGSGGRALTAYSGTEYVYEDANSPVLSPDNSTVAFWYRRVDGNQKVFWEIRLVDVATTNSRTLVTGFNPSARGAIAWSPDGSRILAACEDRADDTDRFALNVFDVETGHHLHTIPTPPTGGRIHGADWR